MELKELIEQVEGFDALPPREKIRLFAWHLHANKAREAFDNAAIRACYDELHIADPNVSKYLTRMAEARPPDLVKIGGNYKLERSVRASLDTKYGVHHSVVQVSKLLADLPGKVPDLAEKNFLIEAMKCYRVEAYRACVVMTWNLAYSHLLYWILADSTRLNDFNMAILRRFPKKPPITISKYDEFEELKELKLLRFAIQQLSLTEISSAFSGKSSGNEILPPIPPRWS